MVLEFLTILNQSNLLEILSLSDEKDGIFLDFFSGSNTSAQSLLELNMMDGKNGKFIEVQLPEKTHSDSESIQERF